MGMTRYRLGTMSVERGEGWSVARLGIRLAAAALFLMFGCISLSSRYETRAEAWGVPGEQQHRICRIIGHCFRDTGMCHYHEYYFDHYIVRRVEKLDAEGRRLRGWDES